MKIKNITFKEIEEANKLILENAEELLEESKILFKNKKYPRSYFLAHTSIEEITKIFPLSTLAMEAILKQKINWKNFNDKFCSHRYKAFQLSLLNKCLDFFSEEKMKKLPKDHEKAMAMISFGLFLLAKELGITKDSKEKQSRRNACLYVDYINKHFLKPSSVITREETSEFIKICSKIVNQFKEQNLLSNLQKVKKNIKKPKARKALSLSKKEKAKIIFDLLSGE